MRIAIRTDASLEIGTGHVMRCITLAEALKGKGADVLFICRELPGNLIAFIQKHGYEVISLGEADNSQSDSLNDGDTFHHRWLGVSLEKDAEDTYQALSKQKNCSWLVVDHYAIDKSWELKQTDVVNKIFVIDDLADRKHSCEVLLDQNYYSDMLGRYNNLVPQSTQKLLGPAYSLLRKEFREQRACLAVESGTVKSIFVFFGGVDIKNMTGRVIEAIIELALQNVQVNAVIGATNPHREALKLLCETTTNIKLHVQASNMAEMMAQADLSIGGGGTVTWERCCVGLPAIAWPVADNQKKLLKDSAEAGLVYLPDFIEPKSKEISIHINALLQNKSLRKSMKNKGMSLIDGKGAIRVATLLCSPVISVREALREDSQNIFIWRNAPSVRQYSHSSNEVDIDAHKVWFEKVMSDSNRHILIGSLSGDDIGVVRFDVQGKECEISIYLLSDKSGKGLGSALLNAGERWLRENRPEVKYIVAEVLSENKASIKLFEKSAYTLNDLRYRKSIDNV